jgi:glycerol kinase
VLDIPSALMPDVVASANVAGFTDADNVGAEIPIAGIAGDQQAALFGQACFDAGQAKNTYGTGCFLLLNVGHTRVDPGAVEAATGLKFADLRVDGGACRNDFLMQFQADLLGCPVDRSRYLESTGMGAAFLAGLAVGFWKSSAVVAALRSSEKIFLPKIDLDRRRQIYGGWRNAVGRVKSRVWQWVI